MEGRPCDNGGRDWTDAVASQGTLTIARSSQKVGRGQEGFFSRAWTRWQPGAFHALSLHKVQLWMYLLHTCSPLNNFLSRLAPSPNTSLLNLKSWCYLWLFFLLFPLSPPSPLTWPLKPHNSPLATSLCSVQTVCPARAQVISRARFLTWVWACLIHLGTGPVGEI